MELVELKPLRPFVGSYVCKLSDADSIDEVLGENDDGVVVKKQVPRKRFVGLVSVERAARPYDIERHIAGTLPERFELVGDWSKPREGMALIEHPEHRTVHVPADVAADLIERELATHASGLAAVMSKLPRLGDRKKPVKGN